MRRSLVFFMRPDEFSSTVQEVAGRLGLAVVLQRYGKNRRLEIAAAGDPLTMGDGLPADALFLSRSPPDLGSVDPARVNPPRWGWVGSDVPREDAAVLYQVQMGAKGDADADGSDPAHNPRAAIELFGRVAPAFRRRLSRPVWATNVRTGGAAAYREIGYSPGVVDWVRRGGELRQRGVANIRFSLEAPSGEARRDRAGGSADR